MDNELIYHWNKLNRHIYKQLCIPRELRHKIISLLHDKISQGIRVCIKCMKTQFDIFGGIIYTKTCKTMCCKLYLKTNTGHSPKIPLNSFEIPSAPFQTIHVDLLKFHTPSKGNNFILVII